MVKEDFLSFPNVKNIRFYTLYYILFLSTLSTYSFVRGYSTKWKQYLTP